MKRKIIKLLARIRRSKFFKIFFSSLVIISVLISSFVIPSFALEIPAFELRADTYYFDLRFRDVDTPEFANTDFTLNFNFSSGNISFTSMRFRIDSDGTLYLYYGDRLVYDTYNGFAPQPDLYGNHPELAFLFVPSDVSISNPPLNSITIFNKFFIRFDAVDQSYFNGVKYYGVYDGFLEGYDNGYDAGYSEGESFGYNQGYFDGLNSADSDNFGQNIIGDTLSAPFKALNSFVIFTAPNGTDITLGYVFGGMLALILFLGFLKLFAGG